MGVITVDLANGSFNGERAKTGFSARSIRSESSAIKISNASGGIEIDHLQYGLAGPVPEPETYALMLGGLGLLGFVSRRRRQGR